MMANDRSTSDANARFGQWISPEVVNRLPKVRRSFDLSRDPYIRAQLLDQPVRQDKGRTESSGGSGMIKRDKPAPTHTPPPKWRRSVDRRNFQGRWLTEQRDAAMSQKTNQKVIQEPSSRQRPPKLPTR